MHSTAVPTSAKKGGNPNGGRAELTGGNLQGGYGRGGNGGRGGNQNGGRGGRNGRGNFQGRVGGGNGKDNDNAQRSDDLNQRNQLNAPPPIPRMENPWEPPPGFQKCSVEVSPTEKYELFFPLELTNKDYLRRIFETASYGIRDPIVRVTELKILIKSYATDYGDSSNDLMYLLKRLIAPTSSAVTSNGGPSNAAEVLAHQTAYLPPPTLAHVNTMVNAARHLFDKRNAISHFKGKSRRHSRPRGSCSSASGRPRSTLSTS